MVDRESGPCIVENAQLNGGGDTPVSSFSSTRTPALLISIVIIINITWRLGRLGQHAHEAVYGLDSAQRCRLRSWNGDAGAIGGIDRTCAHRGSTLHLSARPGYLAKALHTAWLERVRQYGCMVVRAPQLPRHSPFSTFPV